MADLQARFAALSAAKRLSVLAALGAIAGLGQAPTDLWFATCIALAAVFLCHRHSGSVRQAAFHGWAFGFGYFLCALRWIVSPFLVDIARHGWMAPFAILLIAAGLALFWGLAAGLAQRLRPRSLWLFGLLLALAEVLRAYAFTGFPWAHLGHIWIDTPLLQLAAFGGPHLLGLVTVVVAMALADLARRRWLRGVAVIAGTALLAAVLVPPPPVAATGPLIRLVQPNAPQDQKWDPAMRDVFVQRLVDLSAAGAQPDLVIWPETAVPRLLNDLEPDMSALVEATRGAPLVFGIQRVDAAGRYYNSLVSMDGTGGITGVYDKAHLVPFGEYFPGGDLLRGLGLRGLAQRIPLGFTAGTDSGLIDLPGVGPAITLICYEGIFAHEIARGDTRPRLIVLITNDAWFGKAAGPLQHLAQARLRAVEQGLPMARVANTGVSAMIDPAGRIIRQIGLGQTGAIDVALPEAGAQTIYARTGNAPVIALLMLLTLAVYLRRQINSD